MKQIPNIFTLLNLVAGFIAIILTLQTGETILNLQGGEWKIYLPEKIWWASIFLGLAAVIDFLDGFVARLFKATSEMGKQLDSLADVVSFGVAPGLILFQLLRISFAQQGSTLTPRRETISKAFQRRRLDYWWLHFHSCCCTTRWASNPFCSTNGCSIPFV